jgi:hypothetical protein
VPRLAAWRSGRSASARQASAQPEAERALPQLAVAGAEVQAQVDVERAPLKPAEAQVGAAEWQALGPRVVQPARQSLAGRQAAAAPVSAALVWQSRVQVEQALAAPALRPSTLRAKAAASSRVAAWALR